MLMFASICDTVSVYGISAYGFKGMRFRLDCFRKIEHVSWYLEHLLKNVIVLLYMVDLACIMTRQLPRKTSDRAGSCKLSILALIHQPSMMTRVACWGESTIHHLSNYPISLTSLFHTGFCL